MLSYQHSYHAGNFADVIKHLSLCLLLDYLVLKDKPFLYLETHSGRGLYNLNSNLSQKNSEFKSGVSLVWEKRSILPAEFDSYIKSLELLNPENDFSMYPGSPYLAIERLRPSDRALCFELHPQEFEHLKALSKQRKRVNYLNADGVKEFINLCPPPEKRGLIFIDPPYELSQEYRQIPAAIKASYQRFSNGVYCLWYPILDRVSHSSLIRSLKSIEAPALQLELFGAGSSVGMTNCGLWIINPPYTLKKNLEKILHELCQIFNPGSSSYTIFELNT